MHFYRRVTTLLVVLLALRLSSAQVAEEPAYRNPHLSPEQRATDLVGRMTLQEKVLQMQNSAPAIPRLNIPAYDWWNEALHGVARAGRATVFPQAIGIAATWDTDLMHRVADTISTEARAKYNQAIREKRSQPLSRADVLVAQYQYFPRSAMGPRAGNLWRRSVPYIADGCCIHTRHAGR